MVYGSLYKSLTSFEALALSVIVEVASLDSLSREVFNSFTGLR